MFRTPNSKWQFRTSVFVTLVSSCSFLAATNTTSTSPAIGDLVNTTRGTLELTDLGYEGTWQKFCDPEEMKKDFPLYPEHDIKVIRSMLCALKMRNRIVGQARVPSAIYKYCVTIRPRLDSFMEKFLSVLSTNNDERRTLLKVPGPNNGTTSNCYQKSFAVFTKSCATNENPCINMFRSLISRACNVPWLTVADIISATHEVCDGQFIPDKMDWGTVSDST